MKRLASIGAQSGELTPRGIPFPAKDMRSGDSRFPCPLGITPQAGLPVGTIASSFRLSSFRPDFPGDSSANPSLYFRMPQTIPERTDTYPDRTQARGLSTSGFKDSLAVPVRPRQDRTSLPKTGLGRIVEAQCRLLPGDGSGSDFGCFRLRLPDG